MLSEKSWAFIMSRRRLSQTIGVLLFIFLAIFVPWIIAEGYLLDLQSRVDGRHEIRISNFQHAFHEKFILGTNLENGSGDIRNGGIKVVMTNSNNPRSEILNQSWIQWEIPSNYTQLVVTINTSEVSLGNLRVEAVSINSLIEGPIEIPPGENRTMVIHLDEKLRKSPLIIKLSAENVVIFDVWAEPAGDVVPTPPVVTIMRQIYGTLVPPIFVLLIISSGYLGFQLARFYYVGWKLEKTQGLMARIQWEKKQLKIEEERERQGAKEIL